MANEKEILSVVKSNVANALASAAADHVIAVATDIYDESLQYRQSVINQMLNDNKADLDESGKVPASQLPSYVDDVLEGYYNNSIFYKTKSGSTYSDPYTGESGKIYIDVDTNKSYRWSGTAYAEISSSLALGETSSTAYRGDRGKTAYDHSQSTHAPVNAQANTIETVKVNGTALTPDANKAVDITVPSVSGKEDTSNKVSSWSATTTNTHYPSEKLVKDSLDAKQATLTQGTDITISGTTISAKNTVKQLGYLSDLNVDVTTIDGDFAIFFTDDAADNKPAEWTEGGLYATGMVYKPVNSNNSEWIQVCWRTTSNGSNMYSRYKNNGQAWSQWYCVDDNNKVGVIGNVTDANIDCSKLKYNLYTFVTGNSCANTPWTGVETNIQANGLLFKKSNGAWQQLMWRAGVKGILYTRYYNSSGWSSSWYRLDSGYSNLGEVGTLDYNMRNIETDFAALTINMFTDGDENGISKSSPWGDQADVAVGRVICQYQKIGRDWYQTVWRQFPYNAGIYTRRCNIDDPNFEHKDSWRRIDNASQGGVTSVNTKTGAVVLSANDVNAVSTVASQGLTDTQKSNARTNIGAGTSNLTIGTTATTAAAGNHTHSGYLSNRTFLTSSNNGTTQTDKWREIAYKTSTATGAESTVNVFSVRDVVGNEGNWQGLLTVALRLNKADEVTNLTISTDNPNLKSHFIATYDNATAKCSIWASSNTGWNAWGITSISDVNNWNLGANTLVAKPTKPSTGKLAECTCYNGGVTSVAGKTGAVILAKSDVGLDNVGNFKAVSTVASQGLTDTEKSNARTNIGAGTSNLTIGTTATTAAAGNHTHSGYAVNKTLTNESLNNVTTPGYYNAGGGNSVTNKPSGVDNFGLEVIHTASGAFYTQILYTHTGKIYKRESNASTGTAVWGSWSEVTDSSNYVTITGEQTITGQKTFSAKDIHTGGVMVGSDATTGCNLLYNNSYNALMLTFN